MVGTCIFEGLFVRLLRRQQFWRRTRLLRRHQTRQCSSSVRWQSSAAGPNVWFNVWLTQWMNVIRYTTTTNNLALYCWYICSYLCVWGEFNLSESDSAMYARQHPVPPQYMHHQNELISVAFVPLRMQNTSVVNPLYSLYRWPQVESSFLWTNRTSYIWRPACALLTSPVRPLKVHCYNGRVNCYYIIWPTTSVSFSLIDNNASALSVLCRWSGVQKQRVGLSMVHLHQGLESLYHYQSIYLFAPPLVYVFDMCYHFCLRVDERFVK